MWACNNLVLLFPFKQMRDATDTVPYCMLHTRTQANFCRKVACFCNKHLCRLWLRNIRHRTAMLPVAGHISWQ
jgi:hypothetical protein